MTTESEQMNVISATLAKLTLKLEETEKRVDVVGVENAQLRAENVRLWEHVTALEARALTLEKHSQTQNDRIASLTTHAQITNGIPLVKRLTRDHFQEKAEQSLRAPAPAYQGDPIFADYRNSVASDRGRGSGDKWGGR